MVILQKIQQERLSFITQCRQRNLFPFILPNTSRSSLRQEFTQKTLILEFSLYLATTFLTLKHSYLCTHLRTDAENWVACIKNKLLTVELVKQGVVNN